MSSYLFKKSVAPKEVQIAELTETLFQAAPATLSLEVRSFLERVLALQGSPGAAADWLTWHNVAFGCVPVDELRNGNVAKLQAIWDQIAEEYGH